MEWYGWCWVRGLGGQRCFLVGWFVGVACLFDVDEESNFLTPPPSAPAASLDIDTIDIDSSPPPPSRFILGWSLAADFVLVGRPLG